MAFRDTVKGWFKTKDEPTQAQFYQFFDWLRFKDEQIPINEVQNLSNTLAGKADKAPFDTLATDVSTLKNDFKKGLKFLADVNLVTNVKTEFELPANSYLYGIEVNTIGGLNVGTSSDNIDDIANFEATEVGAFLSVGLHKAASVWFQASADIVITPVILQR